MGQIRAGVVGIGNFFRSVHLPCMRRVEGLRIVAACDRSEQARADAPALLGGDVRVHADVRDMLGAGGLDAVYLIVPPQAMPPIVEQVAVAQLPLFCEKPPGLTSDDARAMAAAADDAGIIHQVAFNRRFGPVSKTFRLWLRVAGDPSRIEVTMHRVFSASASQITGNGIHAIDMMLSLMGPARRVAGARAAPRGEGFGIFMATIDFASGAVGSFVYDNRMSVPLEQYVINVVSRDTLTVDRLELNFPPPTKVRTPSRVSRVRMVYRDWVDGQSVWDEQREEYTRPDLTGDDDLLIGGGYQDEHETFARCVREGRPAAPTFAETVHSMEVAETIQAAGYREFVG